MKALLTAAALCLTAALSACSSTQDVAPAAMGSDGCCKDKGAACSTECTQKASGTDMGAVSDGECSKVCPMTGKTGAEMGAVSDKPSCSGAAKSCGNK